ncbi:unnamed protein product, partial [Vitis vinifera]
MKPLGGGLVHLMAHTLGDTATSGNKAAPELTVFLVHSGLVPLVGNTMAEAPYRFPTTTTMGKLGKP